MTDEDVRPPPERSAEEAGLHYASDREPGIRRRKWGRGFTYLDAAGERITDRERRRRFEALAIPPAWTEVWISPREDAHLLATGRDSAGRKQYLYHPEWLEIRSRAKFERVRLFGQALPDLRDQIAHDLAREELDRRKVLACAARLLDTTFVRVGNREYARTNGHFGLTTLRDRHVKVDESAVRIAFVGKSGIKQTVDLQDRQLADVIRACRDVPGYALFQYYDEEGNKRAITSGDVNEYIAEVTGYPFTAKDFRTWGGTVLTCARLRNGADPETAGNAAETVRSAIETVAEQLGNTPAVCRDYYIHPGVLEAFESGDLDALCEGAEGPPALDEDECSTLALLDALAAR